MGRMDFKGADNGYYLKLLSQVRYLDMCSKLDANLVVELRSQKYITSSIQLKNLVLQV